MATSAGDDTTSNGASSGGTTASVVADTTPSGDPEAFFLNMGNYSDQNAEFVAVDLDTYKTVVDTRLPSGYSVTGMAYSQADNAVFMGTGEGPDLYEYTIGETSVTDLGPSIAGQTIWSLAAGPDGTIWGGTYPDGDIFSYDPSTQVFKNYGQAISGQTYVTALYPTASGVYFGTQPSTDFGELDPSTGAVTQISPPVGVRGTARERGRPFHGRRPGLRRDRGERQRGAGVERLDRQLGRHHQPVLRQRGLAPQPGQPGPRLLPGLLPRLHFRHLDPGQARSSAGHPTPSPAPGLG